MPLLLPFAQLDAWEHDALICTITSAHVQRVGAACRPVRSLAVDAGNEWFVTGSADRTIKIWDLASGQLRLTLTGHIEQVRGGALTRIHGRPGPMQSPPRVDLLRVWLARITWVGMLPCRAPLSAHLVDLLRYWQGEAPVSDRSDSVRLELGTFSCVLGQSGCMTPELEALFWLAQVTGLAVSDRHPYMFSCGLDKMVKCWDLEYNKARAPPETLKPYPNLDQMVKCWTRSTTRRAPLRPPGRSPRHRVATSARSQAAD